MNTHITHTHTHIRTHISHTHPPTHTHIYTQTCIHTNKHMYTHTHAHTATAHYSIIMLTVEKPLMKLKKETFTNFDKKLKLTNKL